MKITFDLEGIDTEGVNLWVLFADAMVEFCNKRERASGGVQGYVNRGYHWMSPEMKAEKVEEVERRCRVMERIRHYSVKDFPGRPVGP